jgi:hypothetical protein
MIPVKLEKWTSHTMMMKIFFYHITKGIDYVGL